MELQFLTVKIFVTGGAGFIGSHLVDFLLNQNQTVTIFDDFSNSSKDKVSSLTKRGAHLVKGDITDYESLNNSMDGFESVVHLAAKIDVKESMLKPDLYHKVNVVGTKNLLDVCLKKGIKNVIAASSAAVYGQPASLPLTEKSQLLPTSPYGKSKVEMEGLLRDYSKNNDLNCISLRFFNVYGKGQTDAYAGVITKFMNKIKEKQPLVIFGDGSNTRDFISIEDVTDAIFSALEHISGKQGNSYNIATGTFISINELAKLMLQVSGQTLEIKHEQSRQGDILHSQTKIDLAQDELNFNPKIKLHDGLKKLLQL